MSAEGDHVYLSTYCLHGEHLACRIVCKLCAAPCVCACHDDDPRFTQAAHQRALRGRAILVKPVETTGR